MRVRRIARCELVVLKPRLPNGPMSSPGGILVHRAAGEIWRVGAGPDRNAKDQFFPTRLYALLADRRSVMFAMSVHGPSRLVASGSLTVAFGAKRTLVGSGDRWPRWVARIGLPALRRALLRDDKPEFSIQVLTILPSLPWLLVRSLNCPHNGSNANAPGWPPAPE
jgi:hypothetical protein